MRTHGTLALAAALACGALFAAPAAAQPQVAIDTFRGPAARALRARIAEEVEAFGLDAVPSEQGVDAARQVGRIDGRTLRRGSRFIVRLRVAVGEEPPFTLRGRAARAQRAVEQVLDQLVEPLEAMRQLRTGRPEPEPVLDEEVPPALAPAPTDAASEEEESEASEEAPSAPIDPARPRVSLAAEAGLLSRRLRYGDDLFDELRAHDVSPTPAFGFVARSFPFAGREGAAGHLGVEARYLHGLEIDSVRDDGLRFPTRMRALDLALLASGPLGERLSLEGALGWSRRGVSIGPTLDGSGSMQSAEVPDVRYDALLARLALRVQLGAPLALVGGAAGGWLLGVGAIGGEDGIPVRRGYRVGGHVGAELAFGLFRLGFRVGWTRFVLAFDPEPGAERVAGGASDDQLELGMRIGFAL
ncbi:MAG TPA: hypothetical protein RMH85_00325 [Polyangiaceae bacterium LLY-WYZ-15_(1-7)]|nr:hypothetical protein [Myxococcales bacterium]MAT23935.1 hypothetical protein [Sandaracinus sp.]HJL00562.1 hypothetical protein [Polyangiaceae bacterium LLY-WYZ-15_(1-7)]MBJ71593.1 hypothetical protein [Sandaracinus sp.]HJL06904.1 hypothetical protein [Polyangiaceae bacterium LLY-WYZ-15_(1-7)]